MKYILILSKYIKYTIQNKFIISNFDFKKLEGILLLQYVVNKIHNEDL